jgi:two-component system sensor histidine kinase KdpD
MSRLESGHISVRLDWYDIQDLVNKVTENLAEELRPFTLRLDIQENMPLVRIDFGLMEQVLHNLVYNSCQYAPAASTIQLSTTCTNGELVITLADEGPGFPEAELKNVFKKFFRLSGGRTGGLGLGLSIVKGFVEAHNGKIKVENTRKGGARFTLRIPTEVPEISTLQL